MANTISDKLTYLEGTKSAIKDAIVSKGVAVSDSDPFRSYADKIEQIESGGGKTDINNKWVNFNWIQNITQSDIDSVDFSKLNNVSLSNPKFRTAEFISNINMSLPSLIDASYLFYDAKQKVGYTFTINDDAFINTVSLIRTFEYAQLMTHYTIPSPVCVDYTEMFKLSSFSSSYNHLKYFNVDTAAGQKFREMFYYNETLTDCKINLSNATNIGAGYYSMFGGCTNLVNLSFYGTIPALNVYLNSCSQLSSQSVDNILNAIVDLTGKTTKTITLNSAVYNALTEEQKLLAASKNWTLASA